MFYANLVLNSNHSSQAHKFRYLPKHLAIKSSTATKLAIAVEAYTRMWLKPESSRAIKMLLHSRRYDKLLNWIISPSIKLFPVVVIWMMIPTWFSAIRECTVQEIARKKSFSICIVRARGRRRKLNSISLPSTLSIVGGWKRRIPRN